MGFNSAFKGLIYFVGPSQPERGLNLGPNRRTPGCLRPHSEFYSVQECDLQKGVVVWCRSQWPRGLRLRSAAARFLRLWVRIPPGAWKFVCCECRVLSGRGLCDELITRPEESYRLCCVVVCDLETSWMRRPWPSLGRSATEKKKNSGLIMSFSG